MGWTLFRASSLHHAYGYFKALFGLTHPPGGQEALRLTRHFRHAAWHFGDYDAALVAKEKPNIVIEERIERALFFRAGRKP